MKDISSSVRSSQIVDYTLTQNASMAFETSEKEILCSADMGISIIQLSVPEFCEIQKD